MAIIKPRWKAQWNCTVIEKFYYTATGQLFQAYDVKQPRMTLVKEDVYEGRIMLDRGKGVFFVDWSTRNMFKITAKQLDELRTELKNFMDGLRTKSLVHDIDTWTRIILWYQTEHAVKAAAAFDANGKIVRLAIWDKEKKQFVPKQDLVHHYGIEHEPFTEARWRQVEASLQLYEECREAQRRYEQATHRFHLRENNMTYLKVLRSMRDTYRKQTVVLEGVLSLRKSGAKK